MEYSYYQEYIAYSWYYWIENTVWHKNFMEYNFSFTVSGRTVKLKFVNWCPWNVNLINVKTSFGIGLP